MMLKEEEISDESLNEIIKLLKNLQNKNAIKFLNSFLEKSDEILDAFLSWINRPENTNIVQNLLLVVGFSKNVEFEKFKKILKALAYGINKGYEEIEKENKIGVVGLLRALRDPDINRSIRLILSILKSMGEKLKEE
ncbi:MAG: DUF1641 domain-containing protein [Thermoproteota archaeon]|jgi:Uncharacterized conserved protein